jgi:F-type H+-transporting ATPase subunit b
MKKSLLLSLLLIPAFLLASGSEGEVSRYMLQTGRESDFWPRVINFSIFAIVVYYLVANPIKSFFKGRSEDIETSLEEIEQRLQKAKDEKQEAQNRLDESEKKAKEILVDAKAEAEFLAKKIIETNENDLISLDKQFEEKTSLEERKSAREAINEILSENLSNDDILIDEVKVAQIISKKVA